jgi:hypothetical protein
VPEGRGGSFSKNLSPTLKILPTPTETRKSQKKTAFTVSRNIPEPKEITFENRNKTICFLSVFSVLIYIFEKNNKY